MHRRAIEGTRRQKGHKFGLQIDSSHLSIAASRRCVHATTSEYLLCAAAGQGGRNPCTCPGNELAAVLRHLLPSANLSVTVIRLRTVPFPSPRKQISLTAVHLHASAMLWPLPVPDPVTAIRPRLLWTCHAQQCSNVSGRYGSARTSVRCSQHPLPPDMRWHVAPAATATAQVGTEQQALVGLGTAATELRGRDAHLDGLSGEQRAAVLAGPQHVRRALGPTQTIRPRRHSGEDSGHDSRLKGVLCGSVA